MGPHLKPFECGKASRPWGMREDGNLGIAATH